MDATTDTNQSLIQADMLLAMSRHFVITTATDESDESAEVEHLRALCDVLRDVAPADVVEAWHDWINALAGADQSQQHAERIRLFETAMPCPVHQCAYVRRDKGAILADISGFYQAFGFALSPEHTDRPDHLSCELQYIALLLVMQYQTARTRQEEPCTLVQQALRAFVADHLSDWIFPFCDRLEHTAQQPAMAQLARTLRACWQWISTSQHWPPPGQERIEPHIPSTEETPYECDAVAVPTEGGLANATVPVTINRQMP